MRTRLLSLVAVPLFVAIGCDGSGPVHTASVVTGPAIDLGSVEGADKAIVMGNLRAALEGALEDRAYEPLHPEIDALRTNDAELERIACALLAGVEESDGYTYGHLGLGYEMTPEGVAKRYALLNIIVYGSTPSDMLRQHEAQHARISEQVLSRVAQRCCDAASARHPDDPDMAAQAALDSISAAIASAQSSYDDATDHGISGDQVAEADGAIDAADRNACR